ncbi:helix-turn-helix domain-containing protein [Hymenobacter chitinivorans]|uniref:Helix-turn-helix protein n=1 Tax=Hymenobacter chitinivorans DSM 11115 TaxID=1121954 RepID=A0A2M9BRP2_9BACT|nr:hypothetical protein [Hymenobacter chitinivorans]PJJ60562.1 hypothetical protein CLV45_1991 [Hymenobacter chitinivorans DSM 11115]
MRTPTSFSETTAAYIRQHFVLTQTELGRWLGVTARQVQAVEAGRRQFSDATRRRLSQLRDLMPPTGPALPAPETLPLPPVRLAQTAKESREAQLLRRRIRRCEHLADGLSYQLETWALQDAARLRRRQGLAALRLALATPQAVPDTTFDPAEAEKWLTGLEADTNAEKRPGPLARAHLVLRERLLREEAQELARLLAGQQPPAPTP